MGGDCWRVVRVYVNGVLEKMRVWMEGKDKGIKTMIGGILMQEPGMERRRGGWRGRDGGKEIEG